VLHCDLFKDTDSLEIYFKIHLIFNLAQVGPLNFGYFLYNIN